MAAHEPRGPDTDDVETPKPQGMRGVRIGRQLGVKADIVRKSGEALALLADDSTAGYIQDALADLGQQICRIAFVGQMNSGKSSLINVLIQQPDFLPTDINPWTTVVTNLHFGGPSSPKKTGASFQFFNWDEWRRLAEGDPKMKELTKRLMPDFDWNSFAAHVDTIRGQARERLGARFEQLAGGSHSYDAVTKELLEQYICVGSPYGNEGHSSSGAGEYSAITKVADIHFDLDCFNFPTTLVDTPGVNDPFLVRDEITRQNLELADIYVAVLTARQPLSQADLNLLRLLRGLNKERVVVVVNKIDEVDTIAEHANEIKARIGELLEKELNFTSVPIILGSAFWARAAQAGEENELTAQLAASHAYGGSVAAAFNEDGSFWLDHASQNEVKADALLTRSGLPALAAALSELMQSGPIPKLIEGIGALLTTVADNAEAIALRNTQLIEQLIGQLRSGETAEPATASLRGQARRLSRLVGAAELRLTRLDTDLAELLRGLAPKLRDRFSRRIRAYAEAQEAELSQRYKLQNVTSWRCNTMPLRCHLEADLASALNDARGEMVRLQETAVKDLHALLTEAASDLFVTITLGPLPFRLIAPSLAPLSEMVAVDPDSPAWPQWWVQPMDAQDRVKHLRGVIETEFGEISERLVESAQREAEALIAVILSHLRAVMYAPLRHWNDELMGFVEAASSEGGALELEGELGRYAARAQSYNALSAALKSCAG